MKVSLVMGEGGGGGGVEGGGRRQGKLTVEREGKGLFG